MIKKINILYFFLLLLFSTQSFSQGPGEPYFPETANGAHNVSYQYYSLRWSNPIGTIYNEIYLHYDSSKVANMEQSALLISGYPSAVYDSIRINQQLFFPTRYFWCVVEYSTTGYSQGAVWHFTTTRDRIDFVKLDDFSFGLGKWSINNISGCGWQIGESSNYTLPVPSTSLLLRADRNLCVNDIYAIATFEEVDIMQHMWSAQLEFNSDWKTQNQSDYAKVELSTDGGYNWSVVWERNGLSERNTHELVTLFEGNWFNDTIYTVQVRFKSLQSGTDSWWAIDNVGIIGSVGILTHIHPYMTSVKVNYSGQPKAIISFSQILPISNVTVERKMGIPISNNNYQIIANFPVSYHATFIDSTVSDSTVYTYRIGNEEWANWVVYSNEMTAYIYTSIPVEFESFTAEVIENNIQLLWSTATETNNSGFEILRFTQNDSYWETIGFVPGFGTTTEVHHYSFVDKELQTGNYQYKLKQIDFDGTFEYSNIIEVTVDAPEIFSLEQNYPNPFNPITKIKYSIPSVETGYIPSPQVTLKVYDVLGNEVTTLVNEQKPSGTYEIEFTVGQDSSPDISSGIYFYQLKVGSFVETKKMILLR